MAFFHAPVLSTQLLHIHPASPGQPLSEAQQAFNRLLAQLEQARQHWQAWQQATQEVHTRYAKQVRPLLDQQWQAQARLAQQLDQWSAHSMGKLDRQTLEQLIVDLCAAGAEQAPAGPLRATLAELHARYAPQVQVQTQTSPAVSAFAVGADAAEEMDWDDPEAVAAYVEAQTQAAQAQAERERAAYQQQRQRQQARRKAQAAQQAAKPSVKAVYRKLVSSLHPDREPDAQVRARKTQWMQRVNQAYEADDLLALLELQWEIEQLDASRMAQLQDAHLLRFQQVLQEQLKQLQQAARDSEAALAEMLGLDSRQRHAPHKMPGLLRQHVRGLQQQVTQLQQAAVFLQHQPEMLGEWLRAQR